ncbi:MAG: hypothetical protein U0Q21_15725 [Dermatophilaceae bacterium]
MSPAPAPAGAVRIRTAPVARADDLPGIVARLTIAALDPPRTMRWPMLVDVVAVAHEIVVDLRQPLADFAHERGCRRVVAHRHTSEEGDVVTVVLVRR